MEKEQNRALSIYVHIPFCRSKCVYCDFLSFGGYGYPEQKAYVAALCNEIAAWEGIAGEYLVDTIFFGGGTPSYMDADLILQVLEQIRSVFEISRKAEITIEGNPDSLKLANLTAYRKAGMNRLSIGLQSSNDRVLAALNRVHNYDQFVAAFGSARQAGFDNVNVDIMSGLPGESEESYIRTLGRVVDFRPEHISAYSLMVEEGTPLSENRELLSLLPTEQEDRRLYAKTKMLLQNSGYYRYEISNYAKEGYACRHNIGYWTGQEYLGVGLSAASYLKVKQKSGRPVILRFSGVENLQEYAVHFGKRPVQQCFCEGESPPLQTGYGTGEQNQVLHYIREHYRNICVSEQKDEMEEFMFLGLRMARGVSRLDFQKKFGVAIDSVYGKIIDKYVQNGLLEQQGQRLYLSDRGMDVSNVVMAEFML